MKRLALIAAAMALVAAAPAGACAADDTCLHDRLAATVTGTVWHDHDGDGVRDAEEHPVHPMAAEVWADLDGDGDRQEGEPLVLAERDGTYALPIDTRRATRAQIRFRWERYPDVGAELNPACVGGPCVRTVDLVAGAEVAGVDFAGVGVGQLIGLIWDDKDDDGRRDAGEGGVPDLRVFLDDNGNGRLDRGETASHKTLPDGKYTFPIPTRYQQAGGALPPLVLEQAVGADCSAPDDCAVTGLRSISGRAITADHGVARPVVIFAHGYGGAEIGCPGKQLWFNLATAGPDLMDMRLGADGQGLRVSDGGSVCSQNAGVTGLVKAVGGEDIYGSASAHFDAIAWPGRHLDYVWDWRKAPDTAVTGLDAMIDQVRREVGVSRVQLVGHSMGGLVIREYLTDPARAAKVQRVATVGTPYWGSPKPIFPLTAGVEVPFSSSMDALLDNDGLKAASRSFPGHFALMPSAAYGPWLTVDGGRPLGVDGVGAYLQTLGIGSLLLARGAAEHARVLDHYDDRGVDYQVIVGGGVPTMGRVGITHAQEGGSFAIDWVDGDGTVPAISAAHDTPRDNLHVVCGVTHVPITSDPQTTRLLDPFLIRGEPMRDEQATCPWTAREVSVYSAGSLSAKAAQTGKAAQVIAGGRRYALNAAEAAGLVQVIKVGATTKIVGGAGVRLELPAGGTATVRDITARGAGREQRYVLDGATSIPLSGRAPAGAVARDVKPPRTTLRWHGRKLVLRTNERARSYVVIGGKTRAYRKPIRATRGRFYSVDIWGNVERPRPFRSR